MQFSGEDRTGQSPQISEGLAAGNRREVLHGRLCTCVVVGAAQMSWGGGAGGLGAGEEGCVATPWEVIMNLGSGASLPCRENSSVSN